MCIEHLPFANAGGTTVMCSWGPYLIGMYSKVKETAHFRIKKNNFPVTKKIK